MTGAALALLLGSLVPGVRAQDRVITLGGDMIGPYRPVQTVADPDFEAVRALFRTADIGIANQEGAIFDLNDFDGFPAPENGGGYPLSPRATAAELRAMGISLVSKGNNHGTDWGAHGLIATLHSLSDADITVAGAGVDAATACAPVSKGPVTMVSAATTFPPMSLPVAPVSRHGITSRPGPGICAIHVHAVRRVTPEQLATIRTIAGPVDIAADASNQTVRIGDQIFRADARSGIDWEMKATDLAPVITAIETAKKRAALVVFAVHAHETAGTDDPLPPTDFEPLIIHRANEAPGADNPLPASFVPALFHQAIDTGADIVMRTGPHALNGIEIYKGKPIFYGLASLFFDFGGRRSYIAPGGQSMTLSPNWFDTVIPRLVYHREKLIEIRLYPAVIDGDAGPTGGLPRLAKGADALRILSRLRDLSRAYGTSVRIEGDVAVIHPL